MSEQQRNDELEALIAGDRAGALEPDEAAELALLADLLADPSTWAEPSADLEDAVLRAVAAAEPATAPAEAPARAARARASRSRRIGLGAVAAAAAAAIVVGSIVATSGGPGTDFTGRLSATALAPGARASVGVTHNKAGFRVALDASGLPTLPAGEYYQAWLKNAGGTLVPIGTFSSSDAHVTLWSGVSPKDYPTLTVTIEAADNDQTSSGRRVLTGIVQAH